MFQDEDLGLAEWEEKSKPYPYLTHALKTLSPDLGIMLEVKANIPEEVRHCMKTFYRDMIVHFFVIILHFIAIVPISCHYFLQERNTHALPDWSPYCNNDTYYL
jgi:hypothetical protein